MNRTLIILVTLVLLVAVAIGITLFLQSQKQPVANQPDTYPIEQPAYNIPVSYVPPQLNTEQAVQDAYKAELAKYPSDNTKLLQTVVVGNFALQAYAGDITGGQALLKFDQIQGKWTLVDGGGGEWSLYGLILAHVPRATATALLEGMSQ